MHRGTALVVIDVQVGLALGPPPAWRFDEVLARIKDLVARARDAEVPVIFVQDDDVGGGVGSADWQLHPALTPIGAELAIRKGACDSFHGTSLQRELDERQVRRLVVCGMKTEYCIDTTCRRATGLGYDVTLVADAHTTSDSRTLSADRIVAHHNHVLDGFGTDRGAIAVAPAAEVLLERAP